MSLHFKLFLHSKQFCISYCFLGIESHWVRSHKHNERLCFKMCVCLYNIFIFKSHNVKRLYQFIIIPPVYEYHDCWQFLFFLFNDLIDQKKISDSKIEIFVSYLVIFKFPLPSHFSSSVSLTKRDRLGSELEISLLFHVAA